MVEDNEADIKQQITIFIAEIYDYLNSKSDSINLNQLIQDIFLDDEFIATMVENADLKPALEEFVEGVIADARLIEQLAAAAARLDGALAFRRAQEQAPAGD